MSIIDRLSGNVRYCSKILRAAGIVCLVMAIAYASLYFIDIPYKGTIEVKRIQHEQSNAFMADTGIVLPLRLLLSLNGDSVTSPNASRMSLYENGKPLGPAHSYHASVRQEGNGAYSHWGRHLYFSAGDNSNPLTNGRVYTYRIFLHPNLFLLIFLCIAAAAGLKAERVLRIFFKKWLLSLTLILCVPAFLYCIILSLNFINPLILIGKALYLILFGVGFGVYIFCVFASSRISSPQKIFNIIFSVALTLVWGFLLIETLFRIAPVPTTLALNPAVKYTWPDWAYFKLNNFGYIDRDYVKEKPENTFRILCVGDSYTAGAGCSRNDTFAAVTERLLNKKLAGMNLNLRVEAYNMGSCGMNSPEKVAIIEKESAVFSPDMVIMQYALNDPIMHTQGGGSEQRSTPLWCENIHNLFIVRLRSYAYYWCFCHFTIFKNKQITTGNTDFNIAVHQKDTKNWLGVVKNIKYLKELSSQRHFAVIAVILPTYFSVPFAKYKEIYGSVHAQVVDAYTQNNIDAYDLISYYEPRLASLAECAYSTIDPHPNAKAHFLTGEFLADKVWQTPSFQKMLKNAGNKSNR